MSEATKLVNKRDFSSYAYMVDFPRPGHIYSMLLCTKCVCSIQLLKCFLCYYNSIILNAFLCRCYTYVSCIILYNYVSLSMVVLNSRIDPEKNGIQNFSRSKTHLRVGFTRKNRLKCIGTSIIMLYLC